MEMPRNIRCTILTSNSVVTPFELADQLVELSGKMNRKPLPLPVRGADGSTSISLQEPGTVLLNSIAWGGEHKNSDCSMQIQLTIYEEPMDYYGADGKRIYPLADLVIPGLADMVFAASGIQGEFLPGPMFAAHELN